MLRLEGLARRRSRRAPICDKAQGKCQFGLQIESFRRNAFGGPTAGAHGAWLRLLCGFGLAEVGHVLELDTLCWFTFEVEFFTGTGSARGFCW